MKKKHLFLIFLVISIGTIGVIAWIFLWKPYLTLRSEQQNCQESIKKILKSPASAQFSEFEKFINGDIWYEVDSQNSYGALIRWSYVCEKVGKLYFVKRIENGNKEGYKSFVEKRNILKEKMEEKIERCKKIQANKKNIENSPFADAFPIPDIDDVCGDILPYV